MNSSTAKSEKANMTILKEGQNCRRTMPSHRSKGDIVNPWTRIERMTTPKVIETSNSRCGKSLERLSTSTMGNPPRNPPQFRITLHAQPSVNPTVHTSQGRAILSETR
jgi:hypothetical protein